MKIRLNPLAERQLAALPAPAARRVVRALHILAEVPRSGRRYPDDSELSGLWFKTIVVRARRWSYRVTYEILPREVVVYALASSAHPIHPADLVRPPDEDE